MAIPVMGKLVYFHVDFTVSFLLDSVIDYIGLSQIVVTKQDAIFYSSMGRNQWPSTGVVVCHK